MTAFEDNLRQTMSVLDRYQVPDAVDDTSDDHGWQRAGLDKYRTLAASHQRPALHPTEIQQAALHLGQAHLAGQQRQEPHTNWKARLADAQPFQAQAPRRPSAGSATQAGRGHLQTHAAHDPEVLQSGFDEQRLKSEFDRKYGQRGHMQALHAGSSHTFGSGSQWQAGPSAAGLVATWAGASQHSTGRPDQPFSSIRRSSV